MEKEPLVCCVCLTKDRPQMLQRVIACFQAQTYANRYLYILDSGMKPAVESLPVSYPEHGIMYHRTRSESAYSIGASRNYALNWQADRQPEIIAHFDDDDFSHPERITEQVALLQASGKECVGYREMLFWNSRPCSAPACADPLPHGSDDSGAWLYTNGNPRYCLGTSLCYWRSVWEQRPFEDKQWGEDTAWLLGVDSLGIPSRGQAIMPPSPLEVTQSGIFGGEPDTHRRYVPGLSAVAHTGEPRMIASIHGGNTSPAYRGELMRASEKQNGEWKRAPQWDDYARGVMEAHGSPQG